MKREGADIKPKLCRTLLCESMRACIWPSSISCISSSSSAPTDVLRASAIFLMSADKYGLKHSYKLRFKTSLHLYLRIYLIKLALALVVTKTLKDRNKGVWCKKFPGFDYFDSIYFYTIWTVLIILEVHSEILIFQPVIAANLHRIFKSEETRWTIPLLLNFGQSTFNLQFHFRLLFLTLKLSTHNYVYIFRLWCQHLIESETIRMKQFYNVPNQNELYANKFQCSIKSINTI